jgi:hypothetical protein
VNGRAALAVALAVAGIVAAAGGAGISSNGGSAAGGAGISSNGGFTAAPPPFAFTDFIPPKP